MLHIGVRMLEVNIWEDYFKTNKFIEGVIMGMSQYTTKAHIVRAALEGVGFQTREVKFDLFMA